MEKKRSFSPEEFDSLPDAQTEFMGKWEEGRQESMAETAKLGPMLKEAATDAAIVAPQGATMNFGDEILSLADEELGRWYKEQVRAARERSPVATMLSESAAQAMIPGAALGKVMRPGSLAKTAVESAVMGLGEGEGKIDRGLNALTSTGVGVATHGVGRLLKAPFKKPEKIRARATGAGKKAFQQKNTRNIVDATQEAQNMGFFNPKGVDVDLETGKYVRTKGAKPIRRGYELEDYVSRADEGIQKRTSKVGDILARHEDIYDSQAVRGQLEEEANKIILNSTDKVGTKKMIDEELEILYRNLDNPSMIDKGGSYDPKDSQGLLLSEINQLKRAYQSEADSVFSRKEGSNSGEVKRAEIKAMISSYLKGFLEDNAKSDQVRRLNYESSVLQTVRDNMKDAMASESSRGGSFPFMTGILNIAGKSAEAIGGGRSSKLARAKIGELGQKIPFRPQLEDIVRAGAPKEATRILGGGEASTLIPMIQGAAEWLGEDTGRQPQSIDINPIVEDRLLPRNTAWVMEHPNLVRAKLLRDAPELAAQVSIALERKDVRTLQKVMPLVAQQLPHVFENAEFGEFDGKIIDPNQRALFIENVMSDDGLDTYQKAEIIDHLNKTHEVLK